MSEVTDINIGAACFLNGQCTMEDGSQRLLALNNTSNLPDVLLRLANDGYRGCYPFGGTIAEYVGSVPNSEFRM